MARRVKKTVVSGSVNSGQWADGSPLGSGEREHFRRSVWKGGMMNYECVHCAYATLDAMGMAGHLRVVHGIKGGTAPAVERGMPIILVEDDEVKE